MNDRSKPVDATAWLYRRYYTPESKYMNPDGTATSRVFKLRPKDEGELSVDVKEMTTPERSIGDADKYLLFELPNSTVLNEGLETFHDPTPASEVSVENPAHAVIIGMDLEDDIMPAILAKKSQRVYV